MGQCSFIKAGGGRCRSRAMQGYEQCYNHRPDTQEDRRAAAAKGGRTGGNGRPSSPSSDELVDIKRQLRAVLGGTLREQVDKSVAAVLFQGYNTLLRAVEIERKVHELERVEEAVAELERRVYGRDAS